MSLPGLHGHELPTLNSVVRQPSPTLCLLHAEDFEFPSGLKKRFTNMMLFANTIWCRPYITADTLPRADAPQLRILRLRSTQHYVGRRAESGIVQAGSMRENEQALLCIHSPQFRGDRLQGQDESVLRGDYRTVSIIWSYQDCPLTLGLLIPQLYVPRFRPDKQFARRGDDDGEHSSIRNTGVVE